MIAGGEGRWTGVGRQLRALALSPVIPQRLTMFVSSTNKRQADLETLRQHIETGRLTPIVGDAYPLPQAPEAYAISKAVAPKEKSPSPFEARGAGSE